MSEALSQLFNLPFQLHPSHYWLSIHLQTLFLKQRISVFQLRAPGPFEAGASPSQMKKCCSLLETLGALHSADIFLVKRSWWEMQIAIKNQSFRGQTLQGLVLVQRCWSSYCPSLAAPQQRWSQSHKHWGTIYQGLGITRQEWEKPSRDLAAALVPRVKSSRPAHLPRHICSYWLGAGQPLHLVNGGTLPCLPCIKHVSAEKQAKRKCFFCDWWTLTAIMILVPKLFKAHPSMSVEAMW